MDNVSSGISKIFIVGPTESILTKRGNRHPELAKYLIEQGYDLEYLTSNFYHAEKRWFSKKEIESATAGAPYKLTVLKCLGYKTNISFQRILSNLFLSIGFFLYLLPRLKKSSVLVLPSRPVEMIFAASLLRLIRGTSVALDIQDIWPDMLVVRSRLKVFLFTLYCNMYLYPSLRFIDKFFHVAPSFEGWLHRYAPKSSSTFIPLGFDPERWPKKNEYYVEANRKSIELVCVSQLTFQFDLLPLIAVIKDESRFNLTIIGEDGTGQRYTEVSEYLRKYNVENVTILGMVGRDELPGYLQKMDIGIVPMISTSIPNKTFDYIASFLPILSLGDNDISHFVKENDIGWISSFDINEIINTLKSITINEIENKKASVARIRNSFSREVIHKKIEEIIGY